MTPAVPLITLLLLFSLAPHSARCQTVGSLGRSLPAAGGFSPFGHFGNLLPQQHQQQQQQQQVLTCINSDPQDPSSLIRLTITELDPSHPSPAMMYRGQGDSDTPRNWQINGYYKPSTLSPVTGSFQVVVTQFGRVHDGCSSAAMGPAVSGMTLTPHAFLHPFLNLATQGTHVRPAGLLRNPLYVTQGGTTVYSATLHAVARSELLGGGVAMCPQTDSQGQCLGAVLQCCTIVKDRLPASEVYLPPPQQQHGGGLFALPRPGFNNFGSLPLGGTALSAPFQISAGNFLAFTDPSAVLAASSDSSSREQSSSSSAESTAGDETSSSSSSSSPSSSSSSDTALF